MSIHTILSQMEIDFDRKFPNLGVMDGLDNDGNTVKYETADVVKSYIRLFATRIVEEVGKEKSTAWCDCGDALEEKIIIRKLDKPIDFGTGRGEVTEIVDHYEYYCFGCDKTYKLVEIRTKLQKMKGEYENNI